MWLLRVARCEPTVSSDLGAPQDGSGSPGDFEEEVRDGDEDSNQRLESVASQVAERDLEEDKNDTQVACVSHDH